MGDQSWLSVETGDRVPARVFMVWRASVAAFHRAGCLSTSAVLRIGMREQTAATPGACRCCRRWLLGNLAAETQCVVGDDVRPRRPGCSAVKERNQQKRE